MDPRECRSRTMLAPLALPSKQRVAGSNPARRTSQNVPRAEDQQAVDTHMTPIGRLPRRREAARRHARERHGVEARVVLHAVYGGGGICPASRLAAALWCLASHSLTLALRRWQDRCSHGAGNSRSGATLPPGPGTAARLIQGHPRQLGSIRPGDGGG